MSKFKVQIKLKIQIKENFPHLVICHLFGIWILTFELLHSSCNYIDRDNETDLAQK
jgi:hypothetical protein